VYHALYKAQIVWNQVIRIIHNEDTFHIQLDASFGFTGKNILWCLAWDIKQLGVFSTTFNTVMRPSQWCSKIMSQVFIEFGILLFSNLRFIPSPQCAGRVNRFPLIGLHILTAFWCFTFSSFFFLPDFFLHLDWQADVI